MSVPTDMVEPSMHATTAKDSSYAELHIPEGLDPASVSDESCEQCLKDMGVVLTDVMREQLLAGINSYHTKQGNETITVRIEGKPAEDGEDGYIEWEPKCDLAYLLEADEDKKVDHYNRQSYITVEEGQYLGRIVSPTTGTGGMDVMGKRIEPRAGQPAPVKVDDTILTGVDGKLTALRRGVLALKGNLLKVNPELQLPDYVDFSTGNIDFDGDVEIAKGIRDKFSVRATGSVTVHGLIEAAMLKVGVSLHANGGMAAKSKSLAQVGGDLYARYLDNVTANVKGNAVIEREVVNCDLSVVGNLIVKGGGLLGGQTNVAGMVDVLSLGAPSGDRTEITLARIPEVDELCNQADEACENVKEQLDKINEQIGQFERNNARTATHREQLTELMFKQSELQQRYKAIAAKRDQVREFIEKKCKVDVHVSRAIEPGTTVTCRGVAAKFQERVSGPISIKWDRRGKQLVFRMGEHGNLQPISEIAAVRAVF